MNNNPSWYKNAVFYEVYPRAFYDSNQDGHGDLPGLTQKLDYLKELGVDCIWLQPIYTSPLKDDGYDISDFCNIQSTYGNIEDFKNLVNAAHDRDIRIIADLVVNHISDQHPWFQSARASRTSPYRNYFVWSDNNQKFKDARIIFLDTETSNWTWDEQAGQYYWHRFYASQPDLNYDCPELRAEMLKVIQFWADLGIDGFRVDAVPYLFEREGTICENLPETHAFLKEMRNYIDANYPGRILLAEANQWPEDVRAYFGDGDEFHMGFHFPVMPRIYMALRKEDSTPIAEILKRTPEIPENCQWAVFLRNHDELTLEMVTEEERQWMWQEYAPEKRMRINLGIRRRLTPLLDNNYQKLGLAYSLLFTLPGSPILYYGDEIGMGDNIWLDDRNGVRTPMQWDSSPSAGFSNAHPSLFYAPIIDNSAYGPQAVNVAQQRQDPHSIFALVKHMIKVRKNTLALGWGKLEWLNTNSSLAAYRRIWQNKTILVYNNLSMKPQTIKLEQPVQGYDLLNECPVSFTDEIKLPGFGYLWLEIQA
jgi:maltose alpha-D-glucosyltransferase/alpha-amylase